VYWQAELKYVQTIYPLDIVFCLGQKAKADKGIKSSVFWVASGKLH